MTSNPIREAEGGGWLRDGFTIYELTQDSYRRGGPVMVNRWSMHVQGSRFCEADDLEAVARLAQSASDLLEALRPFAEALDCADGGEPDQATIWESSAAMSLEWRHLRAARAAISKALSPNSGEGK